MTEPSELIAEQLHHAIDLLRHDIDLVRMQQIHDQRLNDNRLSALERWQMDGENRIRNLTDSSTQFKLMASLATGGGLLSIISLIIIIAQMGK